MKLHEYKNYHECKKHGDSLFPYITYLCSIPLDFASVPMHWHSECEIIYIKKGKGKVFLDCETKAVNAGDIVIVVPGQLHAIFQAAPDISMEYENIIFSAEMLINSDKDPLIDEFFSDFVNGNLAFEHFITSAHPCYAQFKDSLDRADDICRTFPKGYKLVIKSCLFMLMYTIFNNSRKATGNDNKELERMKIIIKYIEDNYALSISIKDIADISGFSQSHFMRFFKNYTGISFVSYLNDYRLSMAAQILQTSDTSVLSIAMSCGFPNLSYFNRCFKRKYKKTPVQYRSLK